MKFTHLFLIVGLAAFLSCQKSELLVEEKPEVVKVVDEEDSTSVEDTIKVPADEEIIKYIEYADTSKVKLAPGFEKYLISYGIDKDPTPNGYILYQYIKDIDSLHISDWFDVGDKNLTGIEGFTNLRTFTTVSLGVKNINFSNNNKLKTFGTWGWGHCMGCGTLSSLVFGKGSKLENLYLSGAHNLVSLDFENLTKLKSIFVHNTDYLRYQDISACRELEKIELNGRVGFIFGSHPKLRELICGAYPHHVDFTKLPALENVQYYVLGRHTPDFSANLQLKNLYLTELKGIKLDVTANKKLEKLIVHGDWTQTSIDLSKNVLLQECILRGNELATICVSSLTDIDFSNWETNGKVQYKVCE
jgi:hypothetical protein